MYFGPNNIKFNSKTIKNRVERAKWGSQMIIKNPIYKTELSDAKDIDDRQERSKV